MIFIFKAILAIFVAMAIIGIIVFTHSIMNAVSEEDLLERSKEKKEKYNGTEKDKTDERTTATKD